MASEEALGKAAWDDLAWLQGRWQHSLDDLGLFTVHGDVALFDRGTALRIRCDEHGRLRAWGWVLSDALSGDGQVVWRRPADVSKELGLQPARARSVTDVSHWREWHTANGTCAWRRIPVEAANMQDRFARLPPGGLPGLPERVSMFAVPPPADTPATSRPWRLLVYGGCLTIGWPSGDVYARTMVDRLGELGVFTEVIGCGVSAHTSDQLAGSMWRRDLYDKMGLRGEGLLRLLKKQGPFDLVLIMVGVADIVRGKTGNSIVEMHRACHEMGARTVAVSIPPSWHDNPEDMHQSDLERVKRLDANFGFVSAATVAKSKATLNKSLRDLALEPKDAFGHHGRCVLYADTSGVIPCNKDHRNLWEPADFIHLTACGYQTLGWGVAEQLAPLLEGLALAERAGGAALAKLAQASPGAGRLWRVTGGRRKGGLIVRQDRATDSLFHAGRLATGAVLEELELCDDRLRYRKLSGDGPATGWVTICTQTGFKLVERCEEQGALEGEGGSGQSPSEPDREPGPLEPGEPAPPEAQAEETEETAEPEAEEADEPTEAAPEVAETALASEAPRLGPSTGRAWRVIGGQSGLGLVVRHGKSKHSMAHTIRVANGSILEEIERSGDRLHYRMRIGTGPFSGWVSMKLKGRALLEPDEKWEDLAAVHKLAVGSPKAPDKAQRAGVVPTKAAPAKKVAIEAAPAEMNTVPARPTAAKAVPAEATPSEAAPAGEAPANTSVVKATPAKAAPAKAVAAKAPPTTAAPAEKAAPKARGLSHWRCVFEPRIVMRQGPSLTATPIGLVQHGEELAAEGQPADGWLKVAGYNAYVLTEHEDLGELLVRIQPGCEKARATA